MEGGAVTLGNCLSISHKVKCKLGLPGGSDGKESACNAGDQGLIPGSGRSPGEGNGNPLQCSWLENLMDGGAWWATVHGVARVRHDLATKLPPPYAHICIYIYAYILDLHILYVYIFQLK